MNTRIRMLCLFCPRQALAFPSSITPAQLAAAAPQRSRSRVPALVWLHPASKAPLCRSSQPMAGMTTKVRCLRNLAKSGSL